MGFSGVPLLVGVELVLAMDDGTDVCLVQWWVTPLLQSETRRCFFLGRVYSQEEEEEVLPSAPSRTRVLRNPLLMGTVPALFAVTEDLSSSSFVFGVADKGLWSQLHSHSDGWFWLSLSRAARWYVNAMLYTLISDNLEQVS